MSQTTTAVSLAEQATEPVTKAKKASVRPKVSPAEAERRAAKRTEDLEAAHQHLMDQITQLVTSDDWMRYLAFAARFHNYSASNVMLILAQCPQATRVASFRTWLDLGRPVMKGEHGIGIFAPNRVRMPDDETAPNPDEPRYALRGFRIVRVFDVSQTEGDEVPDSSFTHLLVGDAPEGLYDVLAGLIGEAGYTLTRGDTGAANGYTQPKSKQVVVSDRLSPAAATKTLAHELAHIRQHADDHLNDSRDIREVEAESVAYMVCEALGLASADFSIGYVAGWARGDVDLVKTTATWVVKTAHAITAEAAAALEAILALETDAADPLGALK